MTRSSRNRACIASSLLLLLAAGACAPDLVDEDQACAELEAMMASCYPDLAGQVECTPEILAWLDGIDPSTASCSDLGNAGKSDFWGNDGSINWPDGGRGVPAEADWHIVGIVEELHRGTPDEHRRELASWTHADLLREAQSEVWEQAADDYLGRGVRDMVVEHTEGIVPVSFERFLELFSPADWGLNLDHYVAGEVRVYARDGLGRATHQLERMVLNQVPFDSDLLSLPALNGDMTKVEVIAHERELVTVYWRVMYSANGTTESDVGSVSFQRFPHGGEEHTLVTFHSAHRLSVFGFHVPNALLMTPFVGIGAFFEDHIEHYRDLVTAVTCDDGVDSDGDSRIDCEDPDCNCYFAP